jgi:hypothetical protein
MLQGEVSRAVFSRVGRFAANAVDGCPCLRVERSIVSSCSSCLRVDAVTLIAVIATSEMP